MDHNPSAAPPTARDVSGPTTAMANSWRGVCASALIAVMPAQEVQGDRLDREAVALGHERVGGLVEQDRTVEQDREGQPGDVLPRPQARLDLLDARRDEQGDQAGDEEPGGRDEHVTAGDRAHLEGARRAVGSTHPGILSRGRAGVGALAYPRCHDDGGAPRRARRSTGSTSSAPCPPAGPPTSCPVPCSTASGPSTGCLSRSPRTRPAGPWCTRCSRSSSTCLRPAGRPRRPRGSCSPRGSGCSRTRRSSRSCSPDRKPTSTPGSPPAAPLSTSTSPWRTRPASSPPSASSTSRRCSTPSCCCAATSTASTSHPTARSGWWTTRAADPLMRASRPRRSSS